MNAKLFNQISMFLLVVAILSGFLQVEPVVASQTTPTPADYDEPFTSFEEHLESIRQALKIPGMSAAVVRDQELVWARGFGYADLENQIAASPETPYGLASVTKPIAAVLIMQLVEEGLVDLDAPVAQYGVTVDNDRVVTVRHLLTHTSEGIPGTEHDYNGSRYALLGGVMEGASEYTFAELLSHRVLLPLGMENTALNPFNNWGGINLSGLGDFKQTLGWGDAFQHYPSVYARLARPYQFDSQYNTIPGMYHLYHNPGAGMISSVTDLAKFDIALDQGLLLGDAAMQEMLSPAYSTYKNRPDLMYGLGWYVQDFDGLRLLWHTGRWSPSTSGLYLKVPEEDLTFIVLANTDNLTVPFYGIGNGDISKSILALSFFRHFIFPQQHGYTLPLVDWEMSEGELVQQLTEIGDRATRVFLERELWSTRQVYASVGRNDLVEKLRRVNTRAYPRSVFRVDELFTATTGQYPVIPPAIHASTYVWLSRGAALWFVLVFLSIIWMTIRTLRSKSISRWERLIWLMATLFLGPISLLIHTLVHPRSGEMPRAKWRQAWGASLLVISGYTLAWVLAITWLLNLGHEPNPLSILGVTYFTPLLVGLSLFRIPLLRHRVAGRYGRLISGCLLAEVITLNLGFSVLFPLTMLLSKRLLTTIPHPTSPFFWAMISFIAGVGVMILFPLHYWMIQRGYTIPSGIASDGARLPGLRGSWPALLTTLGIMIAMLAITIGST